MSTTIEELIQQRERADKALAETLRLTQELQALIDSNEAMRALADLRRALEQAREAQQTLHTEVEAIRYKARAESELLTLPQACQITGLDDSTMRYAILGGHLRARKLGFRWVVSMADLERWLRRPRSKHKDVAERLFGDSGQST
jgi:predicted DNA-binding transcriptional regulator AlpA